MAITVATVAAHLGAVAAWLVACAPPAVPSVAPRLARPGLHVAVVHGAPAASAAPAAEPADVPPRFEWIALNAARPDVVMAWSNDEVAYSRDDGRTFTVQQLPWSSGRRLVTGRNGVIAPSGAGLVNIDRDTWVRMDGATASAAPSPLAGEVRAWASDEKRVLAVVAADDGSERFFVSTDDGEKWNEGPQPEREVYDLAVRPGGRVVSSWAWSASCGGGGEGQAKWSTGEAKWDVESRVPIAPLGADDWIYAAEYDDAGAARFITGHGPGDRVARGPQVPEGETTWVATDGAATYVVSGTRVLSARRGTFTQVDDAAPEGLRDMRVDGRGRIVALARGGIVRRTGPGAWEQLSLPPRVPR